jgi:hypothetical protein
MVRRRQYLHNKAADKPAKCCGDPAEPKTVETPKNGRKRLMALPVVS